MVTQAELVPVYAAQAQAQRTNAENAALLVLAYWLLVDENDLAGTGAKWLQAAIAAIAAGHRRSASIALVFGQATRQLSLPDEPRIEVPKPPPNLEQIGKSLTYLGIKATAMEQVRPIVDAKTTEADTAQALQLLAKAKAQVGDRARATSPLADRAAVRIAGAALKHTTNGGREQVDELVKADPKAFGYVRITQPECCYFCALLASRGPVYKQDSFARSNARFEGPGDHKIHDHCRCSMAPVYERGFAAWPDDSIRFGSIWTKSGQGFGMKDNLAIRRFRALYEGREMPEE